MSSQIRNIPQLPTLSSKGVSLERVKVESVGGEQMISLSCLKGYQLQVF